MLRFLRDSIAFDLENITRFQKQMCFSGLQNERDEIPMQSHSCGKSFEVFYVPQCNVL